MGSKKWTEVNSDIDEPKEVSDAQWSKATKIASFIVATAVLNSSEGNWIVTEQEISEQFGYEMEEIVALRPAILSCLCDFEAVACVDAYESDATEEDGLSWDIIIYTDYLANEYNAGDDDE